MLLAACSGSSATSTAGVESSTSTSPTTLPTVTSTTSEPVSTTTTVEEPEVPLPANDVDDPTEAIVAIFEYVGYLAANPSLASDHLRLVYAEECACHDRLLADFKTYVENGWVQDDQGVEVTEASISQEYDNGDVLLEVVYSWSPQFVASDGDERIRLTEDEWVDRVSLIGLELGADQRWRVGVIGIVGESS
jgi:hypothetical protein